MIDLLLIVLALHDFQLRQAVLATQAYDFVRSEAILSNLKPTETQRNTYYFYKLINTFHLNQKKEAEKVLAILEWSTDLPERYKVSTALIKHEVSLWGDKEQFDDIARDMGKVKDRLLHGRGGPETQKIQKDILARLDKRIKDLEDRNKPPPSEEDGDGDSQETPSHGNNNAQKPLEDSQIIPEGGKGIVNHKRLKVLKERWGTLPPREQAKAIQEITRGLPARYRLSIENYFRNLNGGK